MDRQKKQMIGILLFLVVCAAAYFGLKAYNDSEAEKEQKKADAEKITAVSIDSGEVSAFSYELKGKEISFEKEDDVWYCKEDHSIKIDQDSIASMLSAVGTVTASEKLEKADVSQYGFDEPLNKLVFQTKDGTRTVTLGMKNEVTSQYYLMTDSSDTVYLVGSDLNTAFSKTVEELTQKEEKEDGGTEKTEGNGGTEETGE